MFLGNSIQVQMDDGSQELAVPTGGVLFQFATEDATDPGPGPDPEPGTGTFSMPFPWSCVSSEYGPRDGRVHQGIDFSNGGTGEAYPGAPIYCAGAGTVITAERGHWNQDGSGFGNVVMVNHGIHYGQQVYTVYGHMVDPGAAVNVGDSVVLGTVLGYVGNTGNSFGAHLHWETHVTGPGGNISWSNPGSHRDPRGFITDFGP